MMTFWGRDSDFLARANIEMCQSIFAQFFGKYMYNAIVSLCQVHSAIWLVEEWRGTYLLLVWWAAQWANMGDVAVLRIV